MIIWLIDILSDQKQRFVHTSVSVSVYFVRQAPVVQTLDSAIPWINHYPLDNSIGFASVYPMDSDLSGGQRYPSFEQLGPVMTTVIFKFWRGSSRGNHMGL